MKSLLKVLAVAAFLAWAGFAAVVARGIGAPRANDALPYYASADFTPEWKPVAHRVGAFSLTDQRGHAFTDRDLAGRVYVASFIYTRCSSICPALVTSLKRVERSVTSATFTITSFSVTPDLDTPQVLAAFGHDRAIDANRWKLITGDKSQIYALARDAYFASDERLRDTLKDADAFLHTEKLVLVDQNGSLRGVYDGTLPRDIDLLIADANALLR